MSQEDLKRLGERIGRLEAELSSIRGEFAALQGRTPESKARERTAPPRPVPQPTAPVERPAPPRKKRSMADLELSLGGNVLGKIGLVALILAAAWFIKLAIDERWINESGRIYLGLVIGFSICGAALYLATRRMRILPGAIFGAGAAIVYIAWFGAFYFYDLLGRGETFAGLALLSMALAYISMRANNQVIYTFSLVGAFLAPILLSSGENSYRFLFAYLTVFNIIFFFISRARPWRTAPFLVLFANILVYSGWASAKAAESSFVVPFLYLVIIYMVLLLRSVLAGRKVFGLGTGATTPAAPRWDDFALIILTTLLFYFSGLHLFSVFYSGFSPHFALGSAAVLLGAYRILDQGPASSGRGVLGLKAVLLGMFTLLLFAALTDISDGRLQAMIWIVFAGVLSFMGAWSRFGGFIIASLPFWIMAIFRLFFFNAFDHQGVDTPVFNARFVLFVTATALLAGTYLIQRRKPLHRLVQGFAYVAMAVIIIGTLMENADFTSPRYRNLGYSYVLSGYAIAFLVPGFMKSLTSMRIAGMVLLAMVILKLYLYDIWNMSRLVKILAFASLGLGLVLISIIYQKYRDKIFPRNNEP